jgi:hypothetical protein
LAASRSSFQQLDIKVPRQRDRVPNGPWPGILDMTYARNVLTDCRSPLIGGAGVSAIAEVTRTMYDDLAILDLTDLIVGSVDPAKQRVLPRDHKSEHPPLCDKLFPGIGTLCTYFGDRRLYPYFAEQSDAFAQRKASGALASDFETYASLIARGLTAADDARTRFRNARSAQLAALNPVLTAFDTSINAEGAVLAALDVDLKKDIATLADMDRQIASLAAAIVAERATEALSAATLAAMPGRIATAETNLSAAQASVDSGDRAAAAAQADIDRLNAPCAGPCSNSHNHDLYTAFGAYGTAMADSRKAYAAWNAALGARLALDTEGTKAVVAQQRAIVDRAKDEIKKRNLDDKRTELAGVIAQKTERLRVLSAGHAESVALSADLTRELGEPEDPLKF